MIAEYSIELEQFENITLADFDFRHATLSAIAVFGFTEGWKAMLKYSGSPPPSSDSVEVVK